MVYWFRPLNHRQFFWDWPEFITTNISLKCRDTARRTVFHAVVANQLASVVLRFTVAPHGESHGAFFDERAARIPFLF